MLQRRAPLLAFPDRVEGLGARESEKGDRTGDAENVEVGYENGCNDYITKPISHLELISKINNLIGE